MALSKSKREIVENIERLSKQWEAVIALKEMVKELDAFERQVNESRRQTEINIAECEAAGKEKANLLSEVMKLKAEVQAEADKRAAVIREAKKEAQAIRAQAEVDAEQIIVKAQEQAIQLNDKAIQEHKRLEGEVANRRRELASVDSQTLIRKDELAALDSKLERAKAEAKRMLGL